MVREKRMPRKKRRRHLLDMASEIIRSEGTQKLTLAQVAERCGVTKPIAYHHFGTRSGLLMALYRDLGNDHGKAVADALNRQATDQAELADVSKLLSAAFIDCVLENGALYSTISAALTASAEMDEFRREVRDETISSYRDAIAQCIAPSERSIDHLLIGILGAAEALSESAARGAMEREDAIATLSRIMVESLTD